MSVEFNQNEFGSAKGILAFPDHYIAVGVKHAKATAALPGIATLIDGKYIVKAGTIYPANNATAQGIVLNDVDVTNGDGNMAVVLHGFVALAKLPVIPAAAAIAAMKQLVFLPIAPYLTVAIKCAKAAIAVGAVLGTEYAVVVSIENATFRDEASVLANWTFVGEAAAEVEVKTIVVSADKKTCILNLETTAPAAAGSVTALVEAAGVSINTATAAIDIATVA